MGEENILRKRRKELNLTLADVAKKVDVSEATVLRWETGIIKNIRPDNLLKLADALQLPPAVIMGLKVPMNTQPVEQTTLLPILGSIRAGWNGGVEAENIGYEPAYNLRATDEYVWLLVEGDSMSPKLDDGDLALIHRQDYAENGDFVAVILNGDQATIKKFQQDETGILLTPINTKYPFVFIPADRTQELYIYGVAVEIKRKLK